MTESPYDLTDDQLREMFSSTAHSTDTLPAETHAAFVDTLFERYQDIGDAADSLHAKATSGPIRDARDTRHPAVVAQYELISLGAEAIGETSEIPDSVGDYAWRSYDEQTRLLDAYTEPAFDADPDAARDHLDTIRSTREDDEGDRALAAKYVRHWIELAQLRVFYKAVIASYSCGGMPFILARAVLEHGDSWWEDRDPDSKLAEAYRVSQEV